MQRVHFTADDEGDTEPMLAHAGEVGPDPPVPVGDGGRLVAIALGGGPHGGDKAGDVVRRRHRLPRDRRSHQRERHEGDRALHEISRTLVTP
jgi:hypothetical protein